MQSTLSLEEKIKLEKWLDRLDISDGQPVVNGFHKAIMKKRIDSRTGVSSDRKRIKRRRQLGWSAIAASILFAFAITAHLLRLQQDDTDGQQRVQAVNAIEDLHKFTNSTNKDTLLSLSDGSEVLLTTGSTLTWPINFTADERQLKLDGKAFFRVSKDKDRPFSVLAGNIITTALGTSFWINQTKDATMPTIHLVTGRISIKKQLANGRDSLLAMLAPGEEWNVAKPREPIRQKTNNKLKEKKPMPEAADLIFHHAPLAEVFPRLASYYHVTIKFDFHALEGMSFYGTYNSENRIQDIIQTIALANDLTVEYNENEATFTIKK